MYCDHTNHLLFSYYTLSLNKKRVNFGKLKFQQAQINFDNFYEQHQHTFENDVQKQK